MTADIEDRTQIDRLAMRKMAMGKIIFTQEDSLRIKATSGDGVSIDSQSVEALLMFAILEKLEEIRCCTIDVESAVIEAGHND